MGFGNLKMGLKRALFRAINRGLAMSNLQLQGIARDFDGRLDQPEHLQRIFSGIGAAADEWLAEQTLFPVSRKFRSAEELPEIYAAYLDSPFRNQGGGSNFNNLAFLFLIARAMQPAAIIDSGTYRGASAWAFALAVPHTTVYSFDIDLSSLARRVPNARYQQRDWTEFDWSEADMARTLIYFDDHLDQARRLLEAAERGIGLAIFDDDFPVTSFAAMARGGQALPKIEFVLDDELRKYREISWVDRKGRHTFPIDCAYLDKARARIAATERLPNTSLITGIHQTPYRVVQIRAS
jgi:predicted O-methyltransferase YrrM